MFDSVSALFHSTTELYTALYVVVGCLYLFFADAATFVREQTKNRITYSCLLFLCLWVVWPIFMFVEVMARKTKVDSERSGHKPYWWRDF